MNAPAKSNLLNLHKVKEDEDEDSMVSGDKLVNINVEKSKGSIHNEESLLTSFEKDEGSAKKPMFLEIFEKVRPATPSHSTTSEEEPEDPSNRFKIGKLINVT